jgi:hypothetical protein
MEYRRIPADDHIDMGATFQKDHARRRRLDVPAFRRRVPGDNARGLSGL